MGVLVDNFAYGYHSTCLVCALGPRHWGSIREGKGDGDEAFALGVSDQRLLNH
jgi:hypothetical protein